MTSNIPDNSVSGRISNDPSIARSNNTSISTSGSGTTGVSQYGNNVDSTTSGTTGASGIGHGGSAHGGEKVGDTIKGVFAGIHGAGEKLRGEVNAGIDRTFGENDARSASTAQAGDREMATGHFSEATKAREGVAGSRHAQANADLNRE